MSFPFFAMKWQLKRETGVRRVMTGGAFRVNKVRHSTAELGEASGR
jgi:hypothetical protein